MKEVGALEAVTIGKGRVGRDMAQKVDLAGDATHCDDVTFFKIVL